MLPAINICCWIHICLLNELITYAPIELYTPLTLPLTSPLHFALLLHIYLLSSNPSLSLYYSTRILIILISIFLTNTMHIIYSCYNNGFVWILGPLLVITRTHVSGCGQKVYAHPPFETSPLCVVGGCNIPTHPPRYHLQSLSVPSPIHISPSYRLSMWLIWLWIP